MTPQQNGLLLLFIVLSMLSEAANLDSLQRVILNEAASGRTAIEFASGLAKKPNPNFRISKLSAVISAKEPSRSDLLSFMYAQRGEFYFDAGLYDSAKVDFANSLKSLPETVGDSILKGSVFNKLGVFHNRRGDMDSALFYYNQAHEYFNSKNHKALIAGLLNNESHAYMQKGYTETSLERLMKAHDLFVELGDDERIALTLMNMGERHFVFGEFEKALEYERAAINIFKRLQDSVRLSEVYTNLSNAFAELEMYDSVRVYINDALRIKRRYGNQATLLISLHGMSRLEFATGNLEKALQLADTIHQRSMRLGVMPGIYHSLLTKTDVYHKTGQNDTALDQLRELSAFMSSTRTPLPKDNIYLAYADVFKSLEQYDSALHYYTLYQTLKDSISETEKQSRVEELKVMFETEQKELENQKLRNEALLKNAEKEKQNVLLFALAIVIVVLSAFAGVLYRYNSIKARVNKKLNTLNNVQKNQNQKLKHLNEVKNIMFSVIGHDLKGPTGSLVSILKMINSGSLTQQEQNDLLLELENQATVSQTLIENLMHWAKTQMNGVKVYPAFINLHDCLLENLAIFKTSTQQKNISIENKISPDEKAFVDSNMLSIAFRNLISNAVKFTPENGSVIISASRQKDKVVFCIKDSGKGIDTKEQDSLFDTNFSTSGTQNEKGTGLGLFLTKNAIENSGGEIWVESEKGNGTKFCFSLPAGKPQ